MPANTRPVEWETHPSNPLELTSPNPWGWPQIRQLLDEVLLSSDRSETIDSWEEQSRQLYGFLPEGKQELRRIRDNAKRYFRQSWLGTPAAKETLQPYRKKLRTVTWAVRMKLADPYRHQSPRMEQTRLRALPRHPAAPRHETTSPFPHPHLRRQPHLRRGSLPTSGQHPESPLPRRLRELGRDRLPPARREDTSHIHLLVWSRTQRTCASEEAAKRRVKAALRTGRYKTGRTQFEKVRNFLKTAAYMAWNYGSSLKLAKSENNPRPKGA